jgi:TonB-linked SusC/RagA family outer membrane protein
MKKTRLMAKVILLSLFLALFVSNTFAQKVTLSFQNETFEKVLNSIKQQTSLSLVFSEQLVDLNRKVSINAISIPVEDALKQLLKGTNLSYEIKNGKLYFIEKKGNEPKSELKQSKKITGLVTDEKGEPIIGASILIKGISKGTITDVQGKFYLETSSDAVLRVSYIGYLAKDVVVGNVSQLTISLAEDTKKLDEVVVVGYGVQKKVNLTGAVSSIQSSEISNRAATDVSNLFAGIAPGLTAIQRSGQPGGDGSEFIIRGIGSFNSVSPLIIVDGIPGEIGSLDANDIDNISILKDAASAAIYGVRAANGVILVTTKKGKEGKLKLSYSGYAGFQKPTRIPEWVSSSEYATMYNEALSNDGLTPKYSADDIKNFKASKNPDIYPNSDQTKALLSSENGLQNSHHIQIDGGTPKTRYNVSLGYLDRNGLIAQTNFKRYTLRGNLDFDITKNVRFGINFSYARQDKQQPFVSIGELVQYSYRETPVTPIKWSNDNWVAFMNEHNSVAEAIDGGYDRYSENILTTIGTLDVKLFDGLSFKGMLSINSNFMHTKMQQYNLSLYNKNGSVGKQFRPYLYESRGEDLAVNAQAFLNYNKTIGSHDISSIFGYEQRNFSNSYIGASRYDLPANNLLDQLNAGDVSTVSNDGTGSENSIRSAFGRVNYAFDKKYLLEVTLRYDGSSRFPKQNRFEFFPAFSAGWRISEEDFFKKDLITNLKLRGSWGHLGNQEIGNYAYQSKYSLGRLYGFGNVLYSGVAEDYYMSNSTIGWENTEMINAGLDMNMLDSKLSFIFDYFIRNTNSILMSLPQSALLGAYPPTINAGAVQNKGFELQLGWQDKKDDFGYGAKLSFSRVNDKITDLKGADTPGRSVGDPINNIYGLQVIGIFQSQEEINNSPKQDYTGGASPGDLKYKDQDGDNAITAADRKNLGNTFPSVTMGLQLSFSYKNLDFSTTLHGVTEVQGYLTNLAAQAFFNGGSALKSQLDHWTPENPNASYPRLTLNYASRNYGQVNSFFMEDASYLRLRNTQLGYNLPKKINEKLQIEKCRFYVNADNLLTLTSFRGFDPETPWGQGNIYPMVTTFSVGLNLVF